MVDLQNAIIDIASNWRIACVLAARAIHFDSLSVGGGEGCAGEQRLDCVRHGVAAVDLCPIDLGRVRGVGLSFGHAVALFRPDAAAAVTPSNLSK